MKSLPFDPRHRKHAPLEVKLHIEMVTDMFNFVQSVVSVIEFGMESFDPGLCIVEIC
jgi:hypothetical protein